jgi:hypothetical protein
MGDFPYFKGSAQLGLNETGGALQPLGVAFKVCRFPDVGDIHIGV